jgi:hypothetical protein
MYHVELHKFPHSFWRYNLSEQELFGWLLTGWAAGVPVEAGERRWDPSEARLTVLEGPQLAMQELAMGRGWRNATRHSEDVTARVLADARERAATGPRPGGLPGVRLDGLLGEDSETLLGLWRAARERHPERTPSECLALAEEAMRALGDR